MQWLDNTDPRPVKRFKRYRAMRYIYIYDIKLGMLQVDENEISLRKWFGCTAQLRISEGTLDTAQFGGNM